MTEPRGRFRRWLDGEEPLLDESRSVILNHDGRPPAAPYRRKRRRLRNGLLHRRRVVIYHTLSVLACIALLFVLMLSVYLLPRFGDPNTPSNNGVAQRYIEDGLEETGAVNAVAGMILDYRAFDTFGESTVLFTASMSVLFLLGLSRKERQRPTKRMKGDPLLQGAVRIVFPFVMMYGAYVVLNGHLSPGGGFSGGAVLSAGLILYSAAFGREPVRAVLTPGRTTRISVVCLLLYAAMKCFSFFTGANQMHIDIPKGIPGTILSSGFILPLNICVGIIVCCTLYNFFLLFTEGDD